MPDDPAAVVVVSPRASASGWSRRLAERYAAIGPGHPPGTALAPAEAARVAALVTLGSLRSDAAVFDAYPALRIVACYGTGHEGVDLAAARARGITVTYNPGANAAAVADHAMALVLASVRRLLVADRFVRDGSWRGNAQGRLPLVRGMTGRRLGVTASVRSAPGSPPVPPPSRWRSAIPAAAGGRRRPIAISPRSPISPTGPTVPSSPPAPSRRRATP